MNVSMFYSTGWPNGIQTVVAMCSLNGSTVVAIGWMASWNRE